MSDSVAVHRSRPYEVLGEHNGHTEQDSPTNIETSAAGASDLMEGNMLEEQCKLLSPSTSSAVAALPRLERR
jgi:hypothetical protein